MKNVFSTIHQLIYVHDHGPILIRKHTSLFGALYIGHHKFLLGMNFIEILECINYFTFSFKGLFYL